MIPPGRPRGLGRGLEAVFPAGIGLTELDVGRVQPNPRQPRAKIDAVSLQELADSIREHGVLQPLVVSQEGDSYVLIAGERRWRAAQLAGLRTVPALVRETAPE